MTTTPDWHPTPTGIVLIGFAGHPVPPFPLTDTDTPPPVRLLEELWGRNLLIRTESSTTIRWLDVYELDQHERNRLGIPEPDLNFRAEVKTDRWPSSSNFRIWVEIGMDSKYAGKRMSNQENRRTGLLFDLPEGPALPPREIGNLLLLLDDPLPSLVDERSLLISRIKKIATKSSAISLDSFLRNEDYISPDSIGVELVSASVDRIELRATTPEVNNSDFRGFATGPSRAVYTHPLPQGKRRRLVLSPGQQETLDHLNRRGPITGADVPAFLDNPEAFLPDEITIDSSEFSERVRGLVPVVYRSQPYISVQPRDRKRGWFDVIPGVRVSESYSGETQPDIEISPDEFSDLAKEADESGQRFVRYANGWIEIDTEKAGRFREILEKHAPPSGNGERILDKQNVQLVLDVFPNITNLDYEPSGATADDLPFNICEYREYQEPKSLRAQLYDYQRVGYKWMRYLHERRWGGLLADDMGLGKTVQVIALMAHLHDIGELRPALIVVPIAVIENWQRELQRFAPEIRPAHEHRGSARERNPDRLARHEVVITSYSTLRRDQLVLGRIDWSMIACDEAQNVKNPTAGVTNAIKGIKARLRLACTGTPIENGLSELWCIMDFAQPGRLSSYREFRNTFERSLTNSSETDANTLVEILRKRLNPHYSRRTKENNLKNLPSKENRTYKTSMSRRQKIYTCNSGMG